MRGSCGEQAGIGVKHRNNKRIYVWVGFILYVLIVYFMSGDENILNSTGLTLRYLLTWILVCCFELC